MSRIPYQQIAAVRRDYHEMLETFNPQRVEVLRAYTPPDLLCCIRVRVNAPTYSVLRSRRIHPKSCKYLDCEIRVKKGYPCNPPTVWFYGDRILASPGVTGTGLFQRPPRPDGNRFTAIVMDVIRAMLYADLHEAPEAADPVRAQALSDWQQTMQRRGKFPTDTMERYLRHPTPDAPSPRLLHSRFRRGLRR